MYLIVFITIVSEVIAATEERNYLYDDENDVRQTRRLSTDETELSPVHTSEIISDDRTTKVNVLEVLKEVMGNRILGKQGNPQDSKDTLMKMLVVTPQEAEMYVNDLLDLTSRSLPENDNYLSFESTTLDTVSSVSTGNSLDNDSNNDQLDYEGSIQVENEELSSTLTLSTHTGINVTISEAFDLDSTTKQLVNAYTNQVSPDKYLLDDNESHNAIFNTTKQNTMDNDTITGLELDRNVVNKEIQDAVFRAFTDKILDDDSSSTSMLDRDKYLLDDNETHDLTSDKETLLDSYSSTGVEPDRNIIDNTKQDVVHSVSTENNLEIDSSTGLLDSDGYMSGNNDTLNAISEILKEKTLDSDSSTELRPDTNMIYNQIDYVIPRTTAGVNLDDDNKNDLREPDNKMINSETQYATLSTSNEITLDGHNGTDLLDPDRYIIDDNETVVYSNERKMLDDDNNTGLLKLDSNMIDNELQGGDTKVSRDKILDSESDISTHQLDPEKNMIVSEMQVAAPGIAKDKRLDDENNAELLKPDRNLIDDEPKKKNQYSVSSIEIEPGGNGIQNISPDISTEKELNSDRITGIESDSNMSENQVQDSDHSISNESMYDSYSRTTQLYIEYYMSNDNEDSTSQSSSDKVADLEISEETLLKEERTVPVSETSTTEFFEPLLTVPTVQETFPFKIHNIHDYQESDSDEDPTDRRKRPHHEDFNTAAVKSVIEPPGKNSDSESEYMYDQETPTRSKPVAAVKNTKRPKYYATRSRVAANALRKGPKIYHHKLSDLDTADDPPADDPFLKKILRQGPGDPFTTTSTYRTRKSYTTTVRIDLAKLMLLISNLTLTYQDELIALLNKSLAQYTAKTCPTPTTTPTPETTTDMYANLTGTIMGKCFMCGMSSERIPYDADCTDPFAGDFIPLLPINPLSRGELGKYRKYCRWMNVPRFYINESDPKSVWGRWTGGCSVRWVDVSGIYTQRTCRNRHRAAMGRHYVSKRMAKLEMALQHIDNGCIISPAASLVPFSRGISLYARFHVCVCTGNWCNSSENKQWLPFGAYLSCVLWTLLR